MLMIIFLNNNNCLEMKLTLIKLNYPVFTPDLQLVPKNM